MVSHDEGAVGGAQPERVLLLPDAVEDLWSKEYQGPHLAGLKA